MTPLFSVIIPTYNRSKDLERCLASLNEQTFTDFEVVVCDDGSTDESNRVTERFKSLLRIKYLWNDNWGGPARPRNNGIYAASGQWICFLDSDDWWYPEKLEMTRRYIDDFDFIYHSLDEYSNGKKSQKLLRKLGKNVFLDLLVNGNMIPNSSVAVRKAIVERIGCISEDKELIAIEDYDFWLRISKVTNKFYEIGKPLGAYWVGESGTNISFDAPEKLLQREYRILAKFKEEIPVDLQKKKEMLIHKNVAWHYRRLKHFRSASKYYRSALFKINPFSNKCLSIRVKLLTNYLLYGFKGLTDK